MIVVVHVQWTSPFALVPRLSNDVSFDFLQWALPDSMSCPNNEESSVMPYAQSVFEAEWS